MPRTLAVRAARAAAEKQGRDILVLQVRDLIAITDYFVIVSGATDRQVKAIGDSVEDELRRSGAKPIRREGERDMRWLLLDFADIIVHVFHEEDRSYYELERLWKDAPAIRWEPPAAKAKAKAKSAQR
jgi:ribosome-associated protein